jgi:hypothetical protein
MMKIQIPAPITMVNMATGEPMETPEGGPSIWSMRKYIAMFVLPDPAFGNGFQANYDRMKILNMFEDAEESGVAEIELDDGWVKAMKRAVENPKGTVPGWTGMQCLCFQEAIRDAK